MARSRTGGTSSLLSGKLGDVIYAITRNPDGSYRQSVSANPVSRLNPNTDEQARARLTMATIERAMFTFRDFMGTGFEGVDLGTNSVSKFSEINYNAIKYDLDQYWQDPEWDETWWDLPRKREQTPRDGQFILSRGSLKNDVWWIRYQCTANQRFFGISSPALSRSRTVGAFLARLGMRPGMQFVSIFFCNGNTRSYNFVAYIIVWTDDNVNTSAVLTASNWRNYVHVKSNVPVDAYFLNDTGELYVVCRAVDQYLIASTGTIGSRYRIRENGKFRYNNCTLNWAHTYWPWDDPGWRLIGEVKQSWLDIP